MNKQYVIYKTTNKITGKFYIGKDEYNNPEYLGSGKLINLSIKKYGRENFIKEIIESCINEEEHKKREKFWINELECLSPMGYNIAKGSFGGDTYTHNPNKKQHAERISIANTGKIRSLDAKERYSKCKMGDLNPSKMEESRRKISESRKDKLKSDDNPMFNSNRTRDKLQDLDVKLKGDKFEYLRNKIKCTNIETNETIIYDGVKEVIQTLKISKNKYYNHLKTKEPINGKFICRKL
jgi:group I intron endonuclease